jgi:mannan endo-1,4-beta-mannosidase
MNWSLTPRRSRAAAKPPRRRRRTAAVAAVTTLAVGGLSIIAATLPAYSEPVAATPEVDMVDAQATPETRALFAYLRDIDEQGVLFGHQEDLYFGESFPEQDGTSSDVLTATGDHPAVIGFDTLETAGMPLAEREANAHRLADNIRQAHDVGAIATMTVHLENLATGGDFYDTSGDPLRAVLPGGAHHDKLTAYLDRFATTATNAVDAEGDPIPIIFRPWHENAGSWFWWGAAFGTPGEYSELFRFTVEYLRDVKDVHNLLYAFSPGGGFGGDAEQYLRTYPGDEFVDVLGIDNYDDSGASATFLNGIVADLGMLGDLAEQRGKISAFTEFGISGGVRPDGENASATWYTDVLEAIKADPSASRTAYMLTWANYGGESTPYTPVEGEMLPDFLAYHADPYTYFADDLEGVYDAETVPVASSTAHLASPADGARVEQGPVTLRASVTGYDAQRVTVAIAPAAGGDATEIELSPPGEGELWWTGTWEVPAAELDNSTRPLTLHVHTADGVHSVNSTVVLGPEPELPPGVVDDFEHYSDSAALRTNWVPNNANTLDLVRSADGGTVGGGEAALRMAYSFATQTYTGVGRRIEGDWSSFWDFEAWIDPDASGNKLVLQLVADGIAFEAYPSLEGDDPYLAVIPFADWRPAPWDTANADRRLDPAALASVTQFSVFINAVDGGAVEGAVAVDELQAVPGTPPPTVYTDVPRDHPDHAAIEWLHDEVIDFGDRTGRFLPNRPVSHRQLGAALEAYRPGSTLDFKVQSAPTTRSEAAEALWRLAGQPEPAAPPAFDDVDPAGSAADAIAWTVANGVIDPAEQSRFGAHLPVTRAELARWLYRFDALPGQEPPATLFDFNDGAQGWFTDGGTLEAADGRIAVDLAAGGWASVFGGWDFTERTALLIDLPATTGADVKAALQLGPSWTWCETAVTRAEGPQTGDEALVLDLTSLSTECRALLGEVRGINLHLDAGHHEIDAVRIR